MSDPKIAHIVPLPQYVFFLRIIATVLSIIVLGLAGNTLSAYDQVDSTAARREYGLDAVAFLVFCCVWTWLVNAYLIVTPLWAPVAYNMWGHLAADLTATIFWLAGFAATADWASSKDYLNDDRIYNDETVTAWSTAAAAAGLGALVWIIYTIIFIVFCIHLHRHRTDPANAHLSSMGFAEKHEMGNVQQVPPPQQYVGQQAATPVQYPPVQPTPPPGQWTQSPPPGQYAQ